ncbi:LURP-one-related/scramblase family protein [Clostridium ihumii]|uniref:LURP-one-related/scramblase family protein n=1 Tax=Clostridium ihumii TaxID=1470356 RepID=UPI003D33D97E
MKYYIKEKLIAIGSKYVVTNEYGVEEYLIEGDKLDIGKNISIYDINKTEKLLYMKQKIRLGTHKYVAYNRNNDEIATIEKAFSLMKASYSISGLVGNIKLQGDTLRRHYELIKNGKVIGRIDKGLSPRDKYSLEVYDENYKIFFIGLTAMIDLVSFHGDN